MKRIYPIKPQTEDIRDYKLFSPKVSKTISKSVDLRDRNPEIFDQLDLGSCSANAGVANMMMLESKKKHIDIKDVPLLSRLFLYYNERSLEGNVYEDSGATMRSICKALNKFGVCEESYFPYDITKFTNPPTEEAINNGRNYRISAYHALKNLYDIKAYLDIYEVPVLIGMQIFESFESEEVAKTGIVPLPKPNEKTFGGHAVLVVGYDDNFVFDSSTNKFVNMVKNIFLPSSSKGALIVRNSWSENWGDKGYFYLPYSFVTKGYAFDFWALI